MSTLAVKKCWEIYEKHYANVPTSDAVYRRLIKTYTSSDAIVFDAGCGRHLEYVKFVAPLVKFTIGGDLVTSFTSLEKGAPYSVFRADLTRIPLLNEAVTTIICRSVFEHLEEPLVTLTEFNRILKPNGRLIFLTPNLYDYISLLARLTPHRFHQWVLHHFLRWEADDVFPTLYRLNTEGTIRDAMDRTGFTCEQLLFVSHYPAYLMFSTLLFRIGILYEKLIRQNDFLRYIRGSIIGVFKKMHAPS